MPRGFPLLVCVAVATAVGAASGGGPPPAGQAIAGAAARVPPDDTHVDDPFPIRRFRATEAQLPELLKQPDIGPLVRLPRSDFENRVRAAGRVVADARIVPRITDARFKAALRGGDLVGTAELDLTNPSDSPRFLPLDLLRLALGSAKWADGRDAVVGIPPGGTTPAVWVEKAGRQTLKLAWSLAGTAEPGERRFELRVPAAAMAVLELELPIGQVPTAPASDALLTGPFPVEGDPPRAGWQVRFGGRSRLDLAVRPAGNPGVTAAAALVAKYDLSPGQLACGFEYDLRPAKGTVGEWEFTVDPGLRVTDVVVNNRAAWAIEPPETAGGPRRLRVTLHQPGAGGKVLVSGAAPFPDPSRPADAPLPVVRPVGAILDDEAIEIRLAPGLKSTSWNPGDYRVSDSQVLIDQTRTLTLTGTLLPPGANQSFRRPPTLRARVSESEFTTTEQTAWRFDADRVTATVRVGVRVRRGMLFQFGLRVPAEYALARVSSSPDELVAYSGTAAGVATVELARPLTAGQSADLTFEFRGPALAPIPHRLPFPVFAPVGAAERSGAIGMFSGSLWSIDAVPGVGTYPAGWLDLGEPRVPTGATAAFRYRGGNPDGWVTLTPVRAGFTATTATRVVPVPGGLIGTTTFAIRVREGGLSSLMVVESEGGATARTWRVLGGGNAIAGITRAPGRVWLVRFARPVTGEVTIETTATRAVPAEAGADVLKELTDSFRQWVVPAAMKSPDSSPPVVLPVESTPAWAFTGLYLVSAVQSPSDVLVVFGGTVNSSAGTSLPIRLPAGAQVRAAGVGGRWMEPGSCQLASDGVLRLPLPATGPARFEVRYRLPVAAHGPVGRIRSPEPGLPVDGTVVRRWWVFAADVLPCWPILASERGTPADLPTFLGGSPTAWAGGLVVSQTHVEEVRVGTARTANAIGVSVAAVLFALAWVGGRRRHPFCGLLSVGALLVLGVVNLLGPPWWQRATAAPLFVGLLAAAVMVVVRGRRAFAPAIAATAILALIQLDAQAQAPAAATVAILSADAEGREIVVAPKALLDRLAAVAQPVQPGVILSATDYSVTVDDAGARVTAKFIAHALGEGDAVATLPLADARLEKVTVNQSAAFPTAPRPGFYTVPLPGKGRHEIEVRFAVPVVGNGPERELRFGVPESPIAHVGVDLPATARQVQIVGRVGQRTATNGARGRLEVDTGAVKVVHIRWRDGADGAASVKVREGSVWDVTESGAELTACYIAQIAQGTVSSLRFDVPAELDPLGVATRSLDLNGTVALRDWTLGPEQAGYRPLRIDFQQPTAGRVLVVLTCAPRKVLTRQPVLRFPKPVTGSSPDEPDAVYGLRAKGVVIEELARSGVIDFTPDAHSRDRDFSGITELKLDPNSPVRAFRPTPGGAPELRPALRVAVDLPAATLNTIWHIGPQRADAVGTLRWSGKDSPEIVEFNLQAVKVLEVRGADVAGWSQSGTRVQVWFRRPVKEGEIEWVGTVAAPAFPFDAVTPRVVDMRLVADTVRFHAVEGYAVQVERDRGWTAFGSAGEPIAMRTTILATVPPVRLLLVPALRVGRADDFGWLTAAPAPRAVPESPAPRPAAGAAAAQPVARDEPAPSWVWPVSAAVGWTLAVAVLAVLMARFPRTTWPEQFGLVAGLFGAVLGHWWIGLAAWVAARLPALSSFLTHVGSGTTNLSSRCTRSERARHDSVHSSGGRSGRRVPVRCRFGRRGQAADEGRRPVQVQARRRPADQPRRQDPSSIRSRPSISTRTRPQPRSGSPRPTARASRSNSPIRRGRATPARAGRRTASKILFESNRSGTLAALDRRGRPAASRSSSPTSAPGRPPASGRRTASTSRSSRPSTRSSARSRSRRATS